VESTPEGFRLRRRAGRRSFGTSRLTWSSLLYGELSGSETFVLYFPSRFDLPYDDLAKQALRVFGSETGEATSVNFWDPRDQHFSAALTLFGLTEPPALVLATGLKQPRIRPEGPETTPLWAIVFTETAVLGDKEKIAVAVNRAHELLVRGDPAEIASYIRRRRVTEILAAVFGGAGHVRDELLKLKPKVIVPGGLAIELG